MVYSRVNVRGGCGGLRTRSYLGAIVEHDHGGGFAREREALNELVMKYAGLNLKRFYNLDTRVYDEGALPAKTKELLGLVASLVLRCDDCVTYHLTQCRAAAVSDAELEEALAIGVIVGGSVTIPHLRRAFRAWDELRRERFSEEGKHHGK